MAVLDASRPRCLRLARRVTSLAMFVGVLLILTSLFTLEAVAQVPSAVRNLKATPGDRIVTLTWTAPSDIGGSAITDYLYSDQSTEGVGLNRSTGGTSTTYTVRTHTNGTNLTNGVEYTFTVRAVNAQGQGPNFQPFVKATPLILPPRNFAATLDEPTTGDRSVVLGVQAPFPIVSNIAGYQYSQNGGTWTPAGSSAIAPLTVTGLTNGISYTFRVRAVPTGGAHPGKATHPLTVRPLIGAPGTPGTLNVERVEDTAILTWSPLSDTQEGVIVRYEYSSDGGATWESTGSSSRSYTVTGLEAGETYTFLIRGVYLDGGTSRIISLHSTSSNSVVLNYPNPRRRIRYECPVGWARGSVFGNTKKALIYELKVNVDQTNRVSIYDLESLAIYVHPDEGLQTLDGWYLTTGILYNHDHENKFQLTAENSVIDEHGFVHIQNPDEEPIRMGTLGFIGQSLPSFDYQLYDERGLRVDFGISCYKEGGLTYRLWNTEDPRVLRVLPFPISEEALSVQMKELDW